MATHKFIMESEETIIKTIEAVKLEVCRDYHKEGEFVTYPENYELWYSLRENTQLLLNELNKYVWREKV